MIASGKNAGRKARAAQEVRLTKDGSPVCSKCIPAKCCMYFSTEIDEPESLSDYDDILWMIAHRDVEIYAKDSRWHVLVKTPCRFYDPRRGCLIYPSRPRICREHDAGDCEFDDEYDFDLHFRSYEELERYVRKSAPKKRAARPKGARRTR